VQKQMTRNAQRHAIQNIGLAAIGVPVPVVRVPDRPQWFTTPLTLTVAADIQAALLTGRKDTIHTRKVALPKPCCKKKLRALYTGA
jgi:hypothetical protein